MRPVPGSAVALGLLLVAGVVNYADRIALSVASPLIGREMGLGVAQMGVLLSVFVWAYALAQGPAGALADRVQPRPLLGAALVVWSAAQGAAGLCANVWQLGATRALLGVGEAPQFPIAARVVGAHFPRERQGRAVGLFNAASTIGPAIAPPVVTAAMLWLGWRGAFVAMGAAGLVVAALWRSFYRAPRPEPETRPQGAVAWRRLAAQPTLWAMTLGNFGSGFMNWFYAAWLPGYLEMQRHIGVRAAGWAVSLPFAFGAVGSLGGGWLCDQLARRGVAPIASRKAVIVAGLGAGALFTGLAAVVRDNASALAGLSAAVFFANLAGAAIWSLALAAAPAGAVGRVGAVQNFGGLVGGALAPTATGLIVAATRSFVGARALTALIASGGALIYLFGVTRPIEGGAPSPR